MARLRLQILGYVVTINTSGEAGMSTVYFTDRDCKDMPTFAWVSEETSEEDAESGVIYKTEVFEPDEWSLAPDGTWLFPTKHFFHATVAMVNGPSSDDVSAARRDREDGDDGTDAFEFMELGGRARD